MHYSPNRLRQALPFWAGITVFFAPLAPTGAHAQALSTWKTFTDKKTGVSALMPPNVKIDPDMKSVEEDRAVFNLLNAGVDTPSSHYILAAVRLNKAAIDELRANTPSGADPLDALSDSASKRFLSRVEPYIKKDPKQVSIVSKPLTWMGMTGKEYVFANTTANTATNTSRARYAIIRVVKSTSSFYILFGGETKRSPETDLRIHRFFDSFKILTPDPVLDKAPVPVTPPAITPPDAVPTAPVAPTLPASPPKF